MKHKSLKAFLDWLDDDAEVARVTNRTVRTAAGWRRGEWLPRPAEAALIVKRWPRRIKFEDVYK